MNSDQNQDTLKALFEKDSVLEKLESYIALCLKPHTQDLASDAEREKLSESKKAKKLHSQKNAFPNLAGFCRYLRISTGEFEKLSREYPLLCGRILTVLEDEALNSELSPTLLSAYLKKRIGYDGSMQTQYPAEQIKVSFEHDIFEDGE